GSIEYGHSSVKTPAVVLPFRRRPPLASVLSGANGWERGLSARTLRVRKSERAVRDFRTLNGPEVVWNSNTHRGPDVDRPTIEGRFAPRRIEFVACVERR